MVTLKPFRRLFLDFHFAFVIVAICLGVSMVLGGCNFTVTQGDFHGLKIGITKKEMVHELVGQNISYIEPKVSEFVSITRLTSDKLNQLQNTGAICVSDSKGFSLHIAFDQQDMSNVIYKSPSIDLASIGLNASIPRANLIEIIRTILLDKDNIEVHNCIVDIKTMKLPLKDADYANLEKVDAWLFHIPNSHSAATAYFDNGKLTKVIYHWNPFEMP